jgi:hypothetical protein
MNEKLIQSRWVEFLAILVVGDGLLGLAQPRRHVLLWESGPRVWRKAMTPFVRRPALTRVLGLAAVGLGLWLASRQQAD